MAVHVDEAADLPRMARAAGKSGKPLPSWAAAEPRLRAAYYIGAGTPDPQASGPAKPSTEHPQKTPKPAGGTRPSTARPSAATRRKAGAPGPRRSRTVHGRAEDLISHPATLGTGTGGGLLLAFFAYPVLSTLLQYGPAGPLAWFKAKFLNQVTTGAAAKGLPAPPGETRSYPGGYPAGKAKED